MRLATWSQSASSNDVLESNQNYAMNRGGEFHAQATSAEREQEAARFVDEFIRYGGHRRFVEFGMGTLEQHIQSWGSRALPFPRLLVRYEDLKADTAGELAPWRWLKAVSGV